MIAGHYYFRQFCGSLTDIMEVSQYDALLTVLKKWTFDLSMTRVVLRRHIFETNVNRLALILQVHGAKPIDDLAQQASIRQG